MFSETPLKIGNNYVNFSNTRHEHPQGTRHGRESGSVELSKYQINTYHSKYCKVKLQVLFPLWTDHLISICGVRGKGNKMFLMTLKIKSLFFFQSILKLLHIIDFFSIQDVAVLYIFLILRCWFLKKRLCAVYYCAKGGNNMSQGKIPAPVSIGLSLTPDICIF